MLKIKKITAAVCSLAIVLSMGLAAVKADTSTNAETAAAEATEAPTATTEVTATDEPTATTEATATDEPTATTEATATEAPSASEEPAAAATDAPSATQTPSATEEPEEDVEEGIVLKIDKDSSTATKKVIVASYRGFEDGIASYQIDLNMPSDKVEDVKVLSSCFELYDDNFDKDNNIYKLAGFAADNLKVDDNVLVTVEVTLKSELTEDLTLTLQQNSLLGDELAYVIGVGTGTMPAVSVTFPKTAEGASATSAPDATATLAPTATPAPTAPVPVSGGSTSSGKTGTIASGSAAAGSNVSTGVSQQPVTLTDLDQAQWAQTAITALVAKGAVNGYEDGTFRPNQSITRAEFTKMLMSAFGVNIPDTAVSETVFTDVNENDWFYAYVYYGSKLGIVNGYEDGSFKPNNPVTRQEMATVVYRMSNTAKVNLTAVNEAKVFDDADQIGDWAAEAVTTLQQAGVINGTTDTTFEPAATATRAQVAQIIYNVDLLR